MLIKQTPSVSWPRSSAIWCNVTFFAKHDQGPCEKKTIHFTQIVTTRGNYCMNTYLRNWRMCHTAANIHCWILYWFTETHTMRHLKSRISVWTCPWSKHNSTKVDKKDPWYDGCQNFADIHRLDHRIGKEELYTSCYWIRHAILWRSMRKTGSQ